MSAEPLAYPPRERSVEPRRRVDFAAELNDAQFKAATHPDGPLLIDVVLWLAAVGIIIYSHA